MSDIKTIIEKKYISSGRSDILFRDGNGQLRAGRTFSAEADPDTAECLFELIQTLRSDSILVPDRLHNDLENNMLCFSLPVGEYWEHRKAMAPEKLMKPVRELHSKGWLHLDLTPDVFRTVDGNPVLVLWGDALLSGLVCPSPEVEAGAAPTPLSDYYLLGRTMMAGKGRLWDGSNRQLVESLVSTRVSNRLKHLKSSGASVPDLKTGRIRNNSVNVISGGSWMDRDLLVSGLVSDALARGWLARVLRCTDQERLMPLPGHRPSGPVRNGADLINALFPAMSGVERLIVIDQAECASEDLFEIIRDFQTLLPPGLTLIVTTSDQDMVPDGHHISMKGRGTVCTEPSLAELVGSLPSDGFPCSGPSGPCYRTSDPAVDSLTFTPSADQLLGFGGYRALLKSAEEGIISCTDDNFAQAHYEIGNYERALNHTSRKNLLMRAHCLLGSGRAAEAVELLDGSHTTEEKLLRATAFLEMMKPAEAVAELTGLEGPESVLKLTRALDLMGRTAEALPLLERELKTSENGDTVRLLCAKTVLLMRAGSYSEALETSEIAVTTARLLFDPGLLWQSLTERGRVREVTGNWSGAVDDYRLALLYYSETPGRRSRPPLIDLFVLELRTGELASAARSFKSLDVRLERSGSTIPADQMTAMLTAYRAVVLGLGAIGLPAARTSAALAAEAELTLVHALSMLYLGQLLLQEGRFDEGIQTLEHARAKAGLMGDRHLVLLADLAMARTGTEIDSGRLINEARETGLKPEELEALAISATEPHERSRAILELLNMPAPLLVIDLAESGGLPEDPVMRKRILSAYSRTRAFLESPEREKFTATHPTLESLLETGAVSTDTGAVQSAAEIVARWISAGNHSEKDLKQLGKELGLDYLGTSPQRSKKESRIHRNPDLYAAGVNVSQAAVLAPVICAVTGNAEQDQANGELTATDVFPEILGVSDAVKLLKNTMLRVAPMPVPVLITGETGTGKELVARGLHKMQKPTERPFVAVDCGAIAESILEAELFGVTRGAYTGASESRLGLMEAANGGTLFLDEIGNMSPAIQIKLLRVLETGKLRRLGDTVERTTSFRLLAATNADLREESSSGTFRMDLFYRIAVIELTVPPLRDRMEDLAILAGHFASSIRPGARFSKNAMKQLHRYAWPGNIRELRNVVQRSVLMSEKPLVGPESVSLSCPAGKEGSMGRTLEEAMADYISEVVASCGGNKTEAGRILGCDPKTVRKYLASREDRG